MIDALNPLPSNPQESYVYDPVGNRTNSNQNGASSFNQANELLEDANFTYQYDNNGNMTRKTAKAGGAVTQYEFDAESKLVRVVSPSNTVNYRYDGLGRRVEKEVIAGTTTVTRYVYDQEDILLELDGSNQIIARYTHGPVIDEPLIMEKSGSSFFYHADGLGSITELTNSSGTVAQRYTYSSFGKIESQLDLNLSQPYTFTGRELDQETGLYYYRARYFDGSTGRFLQEDPLGLSNEVVNLYAYVLNNPTTLFDPDGLAHRGTRQSTGSYTGAKKERHQTGEARDKAAREPKHGRVPRTRPEGHKGPWPPKGSISRMGGIICLLPLLLDDLDTYLRALESGRTYTEQVNEDLKDAGPMIWTPIGPFPNPHYKPAS